MTTFTVTCEPPEGEEPELALRPITPKSELPPGEEESQQERSAIRVYVIEATDSEDARSIVEERERLIAEQEESSAWPVANVKAD